LLHKSQTKNMNSLKLIPLLFLINACQNSPEKKIEDKFCECATIQPSKFPFICIGTDNPFHITSNCSENTTFTVHSDNADVSFVSKESFLVKVKKPGRVSLKLTVNKDGETEVLDEQSFSTKYLPPVVPVLTKYGATQISVNELKACLGIRTELLNSDFDLKIPVVRFNITLIREGEQFLFRRNKGGRFASSSHRIIGEAKAGDILIFDEIFVKNIGDREEQIQSLTLKVQ